MERSEPKYAVKATKNVLIPMRDGVNLAANVHQPDAPGRFPVVLTYYPYHKDGMIGAAFFPQEPFEFARRGYVHVFLDMRGTGGSGGTTGVVPMRLEQWQDGYDAVEWLAAQRWSSGQVGMWGGSYGGYSSVNVAAERPPHLKAIVPMVSGVGLSDFGHPGGTQCCLPANMWFPMMIAMDFLPPLAPDEEGRWLEVWKHHLENNEEQHFAMYEHPLEDEFMQEGGSLERVARIEAATYIMGGWRDIFTAGEFEKFNTLKAPKKLLMGPWKHGVANSTVPGPNVDYVDEIYRWFDYWLKGMETGITDEPPITIWVQKGGQWRYENEWPVARREEKTFYLHPQGKLESKEGQSQEASDSFEHNATVGTARGLEDPLGLPTGLPLDQRVDEALCLTYTTEPLAQETEIAGAPLVRLFASTSIEAGMIAVKLNDVAPDGSSSSITYGSLNLAQRESRQEIRPVKPGEVYELRIPMRDTAYLVKAGHRIRLAVASADFPFLWPTPAPAVNTVHRDKKHPSQVVIPFAPVQTPALDPPGLIEVPPPTQLPPTIQYAKPCWRIERDQVASTVTVHTGTEEKFVLSPTTTLEMLIHVQATASALDPAASFVQSDVRFNVEGHKLGRVRMEVNSKTTAQTGHAVLNILVNDVLAFNKRWSRP